MINVETVLESIKRRWAPILGITILCLVAAVVVSLSDEGEEVVNTAYTAEAAIYVSANEKTVGESSYNYEVDNDKIITDARRTVVGPNVAGEVRGELGEEVKISSPFWVNPKTNTNYYTRYIFVVASAPSMELALEAANLAAEKAVEEINALPTVAEAFISSEAVLSNSSDRAANFGEDPFVEEADPVVLASSAISVKKLVVFGMVGLAGSVALFAAFDVLTRRARSAADVERMLAVPVIGTLKGLEDAAGVVADDVRTLMKKCGFEAVVVVGGVAADNADNVAEVLRGEGVNVGDCFAVSETSDASSRLSDAACALIVLTNAKSSGKDLDRLQSKLCLAGTPALGAVFVK